MHETPEGFLVCIGVPIARTGEMVYGKGETPLEPGSDGQVIIEREESEVFRPETLASFEGKPVTITHPTEDVTPENWAQLAKGTIKNVRRGVGEFVDSVIADLLIMDNLAINLIKNGLREVSCGYDAMYVQTGVGKGKQQNIIGNHLALVEQGRAGSAYAINDHKGAMKMKLSERIKAIFAKAQDEAMKIADEENKEEKKDKADDADKEEKKDKSEDAGAYDELTKMVKDLGDKISAMAKPKDEDKEDKSGEKKEKADDEESGSEASLEDRLKALEAAVAKLLESKAGDEESDEDDDGDTDDAEDDDFEESTMVGDAATDTVSRAEILAPGIQKSKDMKARALKTAYGTKDGKRVIHALTGGKAPVLDSPEKIDTLFIAASELLKVSRSSEMSESKKVKDFNSVINSKGPVTAEKMNEINQKFYKQN